LGSKIYTVPYGGERKKRHSNKEKSRREKQSAKKSRKECRTDGQTDNQTEQKINKTKQEKHTHTHLGKRRLLLALAWRRRVDLGDEIVVDVDRFSLLLSLV
jgi:hypothetical protein